MTFMPACWISSAMTALNRKSAAPPPPKRSGRRWPGIRGRRPARTRRDPRCRRAPTSRDGRPPRARGTGGSCSGTVRGHRCRSIVASLRTVGNRGQRPCTQRVCQGPDHDGHGDPRLQGHVQRLAVRAEDRAGELHAGPFEMIGDRDQLAPGGSPCSVFVCPVGGVLSLAKDRRHARTGGELSGRWSSAVHRMIRRLPGRCAGGGTPTPDRCP